MVMSRDCILFHTSYFSIPAVLATRITMQGWTVRIKYVLDLIGIVRGNKCAYYGLGQARQKYMLYRYDTSMALKRRCPIHTDTSIDTGLHTWCLRQTPIRCTPMRYPSTRDARQPRL